MPCKGPEASSGVPRRDGRRAPCCSSLGPGPTADPQYRSSSQYAGLSRNLAPYVDAVDAGNRHLLNQALLSNKINPQTVFFLGYSDTRDGFEDEVRAVGLTTAARTLFVAVGDGQQRLERCGDEGAADPAAEQQVVAVLVARAQRLAGAMEAPTLQRDTPGAASRRSAPAIAARAILLLSTDEWHTEGRKLWAAPKSQVEAIRDPRNGGTVRPGVARSRSRP